MMTTAVVLEGPKQLGLRRLPLAPLVDGQILVEVEWSGISAGTERLLWSGKMPAFPGMGYPLVPGYESVGSVIEADASSSVRVGERVFVPGATCFGDIRALFGGAASRLVVSASRVTPLNGILAEEGVLLALAATAQHALAGSAQPAELIIGHGVLGRLLARLAVCAGGSPVVWETNPARRSGGVGYRVIDSNDDPRRDYRSIYEVSGDAKQLDAVIGRLARGGEVVLGGFYERIDFNFPAAFMKEARVRVAAEFLPQDLQTVLALVAAGTLDLSGLITHRRPFDQVSDAYTTAFTDPDCLKMLIDWRTCK